MSNIAPEPQGDPVGHVRVVYLGPVAPHWEIQSDFGDRALIRRVSAASPSSSDSSSTS